MPATERTSLPTSASLAGPSVEILSEEKTNGTRLARLLIDEGTNALRKFLHSTHPGSKLKHALDNNRLKLEGLRRKRIIPHEQLEKLFPSSGNPPDPKEFDITLLHLLLREVCHRKTPSTGWHKMPADNDTSPEASIVRIKCYRNELCHSDSTGVPNDEFEDKWNKISSSLEVLEVAAHRKKLQFLKSATIDHKARLGDRHPETAATLLLTGIIAQRLWERNVAKVRLTKALELSQQVLGKHFMTAETLKAIADLLLSPNKPENLKTCLEYYEAAVEMLNYLGVGESKESILPLKNFASCHVDSGNFNEAMALLTKAEQIAERGLERNHTWKVSIKTSLALLHERMGNVEWAKNAMLKGLSMHKELGLALDKIRNSHMVREFMNRYPETFPEAEFP
ncbi:uncharacterized protein LOC111345598 [Stylophora pistillata]|uniref:uncharacterized protein LOC111345598 n=1 Tax=Stylophora pistillata TaxID=50429 RepID=UPI000C04100F|nr:uncharacterized protein LOC111345598 [Stylophora pistillata]